MHRRTPIIAGNWKMNKTVREAVALVRELKAQVADVNNVEIVVCPPFTALSAVAEEIKGTNIILGAQNCHWEEKGAYTGEISAPMLAEMGCRYVIIGHSERRQYFGETDELINRKARILYRFGLMPIICVGETLEQRTQGVTLKVVEQQVRGCLSGIPLDKMLTTVIAYEPVWAIGTGKTASPEDAQEVQGYIRQLLGELYGKDNAQQIRIQYGGSVTPENIQGLMAMPDIDGALVGGASLTADKFARIVKY